MPNTGRLAGLLVALLAFGSANFLLLKITYASFGTRGAYFVSQAINALYVVYGGAVLLPRMLLTRHVTAAMRRTPQSKFVAMATLDGLGTFCSCLGAVHTPGQDQALLNQSLIPWTMLMAYVFLRERYGAAQVLGAALIVAGALVSVLPGVSGQTDDDVRWYAVLAYFLSNVPMAASAVYKERAFRAGPALDVWYLTQWVSWWQLWVSFLFAPLTSLTGTPLDEVVPDLAWGWDCFLQRDEGCARDGSGWLLLAYCAVNFVYNVLGLYVTQEGSATLNAMTYALLLPLTTGLFSLPALGRFRETFTWANGVGLAVVFCGFLLYRSAPADSVDEDAAAPTAATASGLVVARRRPRYITIPRAKQSSFQERVIGMGLAHRRQRDDFDLVSGGPAGGGQVHVQYGSL